MGPHANPVFASETSSSCINSNGEIAATLQPLEMQHAPLVNPELTDMIMATAATMDARSRSIVMPWSTTSSMVNGGFVCGMAAKQTWQNDNAKTIMNLGQNGDSCM